MTGGAAQRAVAFALPGDIHTRSGGTHYDRRVIECLRACGQPVQQGSLPWTERAFHSTTKRAKAAKFRDAPAIPARARMSRPPWARGLKRVADGDACANVAVAPPVGAWIETAAFASSPAVR